MIFSDWLTKITRHHPLQNILYLVVWDWPIGASDLEFEQPIKSILTFKSCHIRWKQTRRPWQARVLVVHRRMAFGLYLLPSCSVYIGTMGPKTLILTWQGVCFSLLSPQGRIILYFYLTNRVQLWNITLRCMYRNLHHIVLHITWTLGLHHHISPHNDSSHFHCAHCGLERLTELSLKTDVISHTAGCIIWLTAPSFTKTLTWTCSNTWLDNCYSLVSASTFQFGKKHGSCPGNVKFLLNYPLKSFSE